MKIRLLAILIIFSVNFAFAFEDNQPKDNTKSRFSKLKIFKRKQPTPVPKMVETKQEWDIEAQNISLEERKLKNDLKEIDKKKYHIPEQKYIFEHYNYPFGKREINFDDVKSKLVHYSYLVVDINCRYAAYAHYYYSPDLNQISSSVFVEKLDTNKTKQKRILEYNHKQKERKPVVQAGINDSYPNLFKGLSIVDWSRDSKKVLIKEKVGSTQRGVYKTYLHVHYLADDVNNGYTIKLNALDTIIKRYFLEWENKQIIKYHYDIEPLGFSIDNDNLVVVLCYVYDNDGNKVFLGTWGYDLAKEQIILLSKTENTEKISANGLILRKVID